MRNSLYVVAYLFAILLVCVSGLFWLIVSLNWKDIWKDIDGRAKTLLNNG